MGRRRIPRVEPQRRGILPSASNGRTEERESQRLRRHAQAEHHLRNRCQHPEPRRRGDARYHPRRQGQHVPGALNPRDQRRREPRDDRRHRRLLQKARQDGVFRRRALLRRLRHGPRLLAPMPRDCGSSRRRCTRALRHEWRDDHACDARCDQRSAGTRPRRAPGYPLSQRCRVGRRKLAWRR